VKKLALWVAGLMLLAGCASAPAEEARLLFIDVGKGDAVLVMAEQGNYLIDAGPKDAFSSVAAALDHYGVKKLDGVFMTHSDKDHSGGLKPLAQSGVEISAWYAAALYNPDGGEDGPPVQSAARLRGQQPVYLSAGDTAGPFTVLGPTTRDKDDDNNSLVLMLVTPGGRALLTGDMKFDEEEELLQSGVSLKCDLIKIAHHGNSDATSDALIDASSPRVAVVSTDSGERPELPDPRIVRMLEGKGIPLYSTWKSGGGVLATLSGAGARAEAVAIPGASG
jgi:competence protein ComEC